MKYGIRDICDVVFKAKKAGHIGSYHYAVGQPVLYIDSAKTSTIEGAATTVYATGGRGNSRLIAWEGEKTLTFTVEDALLSNISFAMLSGAGLVKKGVGANLSTTAVHQTSLVDLTVTKSKTYNVECFDFKKWQDENEDAKFLRIDSEGVIMTDEAPQIFFAGSGSYDNEEQYQITYTDVTDLEMFPGANAIIQLGETAVNSGDILTGSEISQMSIKMINSISAVKDLSIKKCSYLATYTYEDKDPLKNLSTTDPYFIMSVNTLGQKLVGKLESTSEQLQLNSIKDLDNNLKPDGSSSRTIPVMIDYYTRAKEAVNELTIDVENFADNYYVEAKTSFRRQYDGKDLDTIITFPNVKIQSNFTFNMAATGDPSTFSFIMDAMPGTTVNSPSKKVLCEMFIVDDVKMDTEDLIKSDSIISWIPVEEGHQLKDGNVFKIPSAKQYSEEELEDVLMNDTNKGIVFFTIHTELHEDETVGPANGYDLKIGLSGEKNWEPSAVCGRTETVSITMSIENEDDECILTIPEQDFYVSSMDFESTYGKDIYFRITKNSIVTIATGLADDKKEQIKVQK